MRSRTRTILTRTAESVAVSAVFASALVGAVVSNANDPAFRRAGAEIANRALGGVFTGKIVVGRIEELHIGWHAHVKVAHAEIVDPEGRAVIKADGIDAGIDLVRLFASIRAGGPPVIALDEPIIDSAEVILDVDAANTLGIARAFGSPPVTTAPTPPKPGREMDPDVRLEIPKAQLRRALVHGNLVPPSLDGAAQNVKASVFVIENKLTLTAERAELSARSPRAPGQVGDVHGVGHGELTYPVKVRVGEPTGYAAVAMRWELEGDGAGIPLTARFALEHEIIDMGVDIPTAPAEKVRAALPFLAVAAPVEVHATGKGKLPDLALAAHGKVGDSTFTATGTLNIDGQRPFVIDADLFRVDGAAWGGPASEVTGHVHADGTITDGPRGTFTVTTKASKVSGQDAPAIDAKGAFDPERVTATFRATEPGVAADGSVTLRIPAQKLDFDVTARSGELRSLGRAPNVVSGSATAHVTGTLDLQTTDIAAKVVADGRNIARAPAAAESVHVEATLSGPVVNPLFDVNGRASQITLTSKDENGKPQTPLVYPSATAHAKVTLAGVPRLLGAEVRASGIEKDSTVVATARELRIENGGVVVSGGRVEGLGAPIELEGAIGRGPPRIRVKAEGVSIARVASMTGIAQLKLLPEGSVADVDVDVKLSERGADGRFDIVVRGAKDGTGGELRGTAAGHDVVASGKVTVGKVGFLELTQSHFTLPAAPSLAALAKATGAADLRGEIDLAQGAALVGGETFERIEGRGLFSARLERGDARNRPTVYLSGRTQGLDVTTNDEGKSTHIGGIDLAFHVGYDGESDETEVSALGWDKHGVVASADAKARVPLIAWMLGDKTVDRRALAALRIGAVVDVPARDVSQLPGSFARPEFHGTVAARAEINGWLARPDVRLVANAEDLGQQRRAAGPGQQLRPIDALVNAHWNGDRIVATITADEAKRTARRPGARAAAKAAEAPAAQVRGLVLGRLSARELFEGRGIVWDASTELDVRNLELGPLPLPYDIRGTMTGHMKVHDLASNPQLEASARVDGLTISNVKVLRADLEATAKNGQLSANVTVKQDDGGSGDVSVTSSALEWHGLDFGWDGTKQTHLEYTVDRMRIGILRTFVRRAVPELDGRVDGKGSVVIDDQNQVFEGGLTLTEGRVYVNALGEEIDGVRAIAQFERNGVFRISDASGKIGSGVVTASATGRLSGFHFLGAEATVVIPSKEGVPLSAEGATYAQATGEVNVKASVAPDTKTLLVTMEVPRSKVTVPDRGTQNLQTLEPDDAIVVGTRTKTTGVLVPETQRPGAAAATAARQAVDPKAVKPAAIAKLTINLGKDVELEGRGLRISLSGRTIVDVAEEVAVSGQIQLKQGGTIDVQGRKFIVDHGTVTFIDGENPSDPVVVASAYWDAPDRTRVWVEFNGPLKTGKLSLRSEPAYSKSEILSILLFGRADPNQATAGERPSDSQDAAALGAGVASSGLNKALGELNEDFDLEQDRTSANRIRTKVGYRLRRNLKVQIGYASGFSQREPDTTYLFLEWQFMPKWSLVGTRGDRGTSILDVLFQHRY